MSIRASVKIAIEVEIPADSCWGPHCTMGQLQSQATAECTLKLEKALATVGHEVKVMKIRALSLVVHEEK